MSKYNKMRTAVYLFIGSGRDKPIHIHSFKLPDSMATSLRLHIYFWNAGFSKC